MGEFLGEGRGDDRGDERGDRVLSLDGEDTSRWLLSFVLFLLSDRGPPLSFLLDMDASGSGSAIPRAARLAARRSLYDENTSQVKQTLNKLTRSFPVKERERG